MDDHIRKLMDERKRIRMETDRLNQRLAELEAAIQSHLFPSNVLQQQQQQQQQQPQPKDQKQSPE